MSLILLLPTFSAFGLLGASDCIQPIFPAIEVVLLDSLTGAQPDSVPVVINGDGSCADTARVDEASSNSGQVLRAGNSRPGTYTVTVDLAGYHQWRRDGVRVERGDCGVKTVRLTARLQRSPSPSANPLDYPQIALTFLTSSTSRYCRIR